MKKYLSVAFLATLIVPISLPAQSKLEDNLKAVMMLFDKNQKDAQIRIDDLILANDELSVRNVKLGRDLEVAESTIEELHKENLLLRGKISQVAVREMETAALTMPSELTSEDNLEPEAPIPDFTPKAYKQIGPPANGAEHLSDGTVLLVNLNTATERELKMIPGVGPLMAKRIIDRRPYASIWDLMELQGMGKKRIETIQPYIALE